MKHNIGSVLTKRAHLSPKLEAFVDVSSGRRFSYAEFNDRTNQTAHALAALGVTKGDRVALLMMNSVEFMESFFAIAKLGAICVPLNWRLTIHELDYIAADAGPTVLVADPDFADTAVDLAARTNTPHLLMFDGQGATPSGDPASFNERLAAADASAVVMPELDHDDLSRRTSNFTERLCSPR